jgi:hypothetical protein
MDASTNSFNAELLLVSPELFTFHRSLALWSIPYLDRLRVRYIKYAGIADLQGYFDLLRLDSGLTRSLMASRPLTVVYPSTRCETALTRFILLNN